MNKVLKSNEFVGSQDFFKLVGSFSPMLSMLVPSFDGIATVNVFTSDNFIADVRKLQTGTGHFLLNISEGLIRYIFDVCYIILSDNSVLNGVGHSSHTIEVKSLHVQNYAILDVMLENTLLSEFDEVRQQLHKHICTRAIQFLMLHEGIHILHGHAGYRFKNEENRANGQKCDVLSLLDLQTLEFDADCCAASIYHQGILSDNNKLPVEIESHENRLYCFFIALDCVLHGLPFQTMVDETFLLKSGHPNASMRLHFAKASLHTAYQHKFPAILETYQMALKRQIRDFRNLINLGIYPATSLTDLNLTYSEAGRQHANKISQNWTILRERLLPFAYKNLPR